MGLGHEQNGCHFACIIVNEEVSIAVKIVSTGTFVPLGPIKNRPSLVQVMVWCRTGDKPIHQAIMI